ncbi:MAG: Dam family site-specific DNA-(adenine-N6)-methyltransferase [Chromatiales bacterium]
MSSSAADNTSGSQAKTRPPLKWAGGKYRIVGEIRRLLPSGKRLVEPFVGSGAVFLNTNYERYLISDINRDLILFYRTLKERERRFIAYCKKFFSPGCNKATVYYRLRDEFNATIDPLRKAGLFLYLNKHGYNGLCRYNAAGDMNVPFGRYKKPYFPEREMLAFIQKAKHVSIQQRDFASVMQSARKGDVIYCDPPYVPLSETSNFTSYSAGGFSLEDQRRLAELAEETAQRGIPVLISNHYTVYTETIYGRAELTRLSVRRLISCNSSKREHAAEILALFCGES